MSLKVLLLLSLFTTILASSDEIVGALGGQSLRCCALLGRPIVSEGTLKYRNGGLDGIAIEYIERLQQLLDFKCSPLVDYEKVNKFEARSNDFINMMERCTKNGTIQNSPDCECDIGVSGWFLTPDRLGRVDFLPPILYDRIRVMVKTSNARRKNESLFFLTSFSGTVWICIAGLIVMFTFLKLLDRRFAPPDRSFKPLPENESRFVRYKHFLLKSRLPYRLRRAFQSTLTKIIGHTETEHVGEGGSTRQWLLNFVIVLCGLFLMLSYEASMTASLVQERLETDFHSIEDLKRCNIDPDQVCLPAGGAIETFWHNVIAKHHCHDGKTPLISDSFSKLVSSVQSNQCKYWLVLESIAVTYINERSCGGLVLTGKPLFIGGLSSILPKGSNLTETMSLGTLKLKEEGQIETIQEFVERKKICNMEIEKSPSLTFGKLRIFFILAYSAGGLLFLEMILDPQDTLRIARRVADKQKEKSVEGEEDWEEPSHDSSGDLGGDYVTSDVP